MCFPELGNLYKHKYNRFDDFAQNGINIRAGPLHFTSDLQDLHDLQLYKNVGALPQLLMAIAWLEKPGAQPEEDRTEEEPITNSNEKKKKKKSIQ